MRKGNKNKRILTDKLYHLIVCLFTFVTIVPFFLIICQLLKNGLPHLSASFFSTISPLPMDGMIAYLSGEPTPGGALNGIQGSFFLILITIVLAVPIGVLLSLFIYKNSQLRFARIVQVVCNLLGGVPSVLLGIAAYLLIVKNLHANSALAASFALSLLMLPMIVKSCLENLERLPNGVVEAGIALGGSYFDVFRKTVFPYIRRPLLSDILKTTSFILGATAPLLITSIGARLVNWNLFKPTSSLPSLLWEFFDNPYMMDLMWATALLLLLIVILLNLIAKFIRDDWKRKYQ